MNTFFIFLGIRENMKKILFVYIMLCNFVHIKCSDMSQFLNSMVTFESVVLYRDQDLDQNFDHHPSMVSTTSCMKKFQLTKNSAFKLLNKDEIDAFENVYKEKAFEEYLTKKIAKILRSKIS